MARFLFWLVILLGLASVPITIVSLALLSRGLGSSVAAFAVGLVFVVPGYMMGVSYFCLSEHAGNLCGLAAAFGTAPLGFSIGALGGAAVIRVLARRTQGTTPRSR